MNTPPRDTPRLSRPRRLTRDPYALAITPMRTLAITGLASLALIIWTTRALRDFAAAIEAR